MSASNETARPSHKRIATEEAWATKEMLDMYRRALADNSIDDPGFKSLWGHYLNNKGPRATFVIDRLQQMGEARIKDMDDTGIDVQLLMLTSPGVQVFDADTAVALAANSNDQLVEAIRKYPTRFAGMAAVAPQNPKKAAEELERGVRKLGLKGAVINSHTQGEYLDDQKYWDIFAAAEALDVPVYIHPNSPPRGMIEPFLKRGLDGAIYGFGVETGMHLLSIMTSGAFDRFPKLKIVVGHCGEALPFWMFRLDYMHRATVNSKRYSAMQPTKRTIIEYMKTNVYVTNSGVAWAPAIQFCQQVMGMDRVLYAMDYPYQFQKDEVGEMERSNLSAADQKLFYQTNAEKLFDL
jgi:5-carboxyvanillate decarboxylase